MRVIMRVIIILITIFTIISCYYIFRNNILLIAAIATIILVNLFLHFDEKHSNKNKLDILIPLLMMFLLIIAILFYPFYRADDILHKLGYIQKSSESKWYVVDSRFIDGYRLQSDKAGDINVFDDWRKNFSPKNQNILDKHPNALYGYMLWNVGNTKIFCPKDINIDSPNKIKEKCLKIKGDYLQALPD